MNWWIEGDTTHEARWDGDHWRTTYTEAVDHVLVVERDDGTTRSHYLTDAEHEAITTADDPDQAVATILEPRPDTCPGSLHILRADCPMMRSDWAAIVAAADGDGFTRCTHHECGSVWQTRTWTGQPSVRLPSDEWQAWVRQQLADLATHPVETTVTVGGLDVSDQVEGFTWLRDMSRTEHTPPAQ
jgi:hypothetical protein